MAQTYGRNGVTATVNTEGNDAFLKGLINTIFSALTTPNSSSSKSSPSYTSSSSNRNSSKTGSTSGAKSTSEKRREIMQANKTSTTKPVSNATTTTTKPATSTASNYSNSTGPTATQKALQEKKYQTTDSKGNTVTINGVQHKQSQIAESAGNKKPATYTEVDKSTPVGITTPTAPTTSTKKTTTTNTTKKDVDPTPDPKPSTGGGGGGSTYRTDTYPYTTSGVAQQKPKMWTGQELADMFGFVFGEDQIKEILNEATNAKFNEYDAQMRRIRDNSLTDYASAHDQYLNSFRNAKQNALQTGASKGSSLAQELGILLGNQATEGANQTQYQQTLADIANQRGTQLASDGYTAMMTQNELASTLGNLASQYYGYDVQDNAAYLSYLGQQGANEANKLLAQAQQSSANATKDYYQGLLQQSQSSASQNTDVISNLMSAGFDKATATMIALRPDLYETELAKLNNKTKSSADTGASAGTSNKPFSFDLSMFNTLGGQFH